MAVTSLGKNYAVIDRFGYEGLFLLEILRVKIVNIRSSNAKHLLYGADIFLSFSKIPCIIIMISSSDFSSFVLKYGIFSKVYLGILSSHMSSYLSPTTSFKLNNGFYVD